MFRLSTLSLLLFVACSDNKTLSETSTPEASFPKPMEVPESVPIGPERTGETVPELRPKNLKIYLGDQLIWEEEYAYSKPYDLYWTHRFATTYNPPGSAGLIVVDEYQVLTATGFPDYLVDGEYLIMDFTYDEEFHIITYYNRETLGDREITVRTINEDGQVLSISRDYWFLHYDYYNSNYDPLFHSNHVANSNLEPTAQLPGEEVNLYNSSFINYNLDHTAEEIVEYDEFGHPLHSHCEYSEGSCGDTYYQYEFDDDHHITKQIFLKPSTNKQGKTTLVEYWSRTFEYEDGLLVGGSDLEFERHPHPLNGPTGGFVSTPPGETWGGQQLISWTETKKEWIKYHAYVDGTIYDELRYVQDLERIDFK